jgi:CubicO group peptidase (beta-lactamase class C family)
MDAFRVAAILALSATLTAVPVEPTLPGIGTAMQEMIARNEIAGAVTAVVTKDRVLHLDATGFADVAAKRPMTPDALFWIASMTKPVTGVAILMLQDEGKLAVGDPVAKYLPEFNSLKTPSGKPANLTLVQVLTHTSGLGEAGGPAAQQARTLADLVPLWLAAPMQYEPGERWRYTQSGINAAARVVEVVSGMTFDAFVQQRIFDPLGMKHTTFYPSGEQRARLATAYAKDKATGALTAVPPRSDFGAKDRPPQGNGGLYSTAPDYARFCQMLLNGGTLDGNRIIGRKTLELMASDHLTAGVKVDSPLMPPGHGFGLGFAVRTHRGIAPFPGSLGQFFWSGMAGTFFFIDPAEDLFTVFMMQGPGQREYIRNMLRDLVYAAVE